MVDEDIHKDLRWAVASAAQRQYATVITLMVPDRPNSGFNSLMATAIVWATAKISRDRFAPVSINAVPGKRIQEDMLLVVLANDAGWDAVKDRAMAMRELDVVPTNGHAAARAHQGSGCLSAHQELRFHLPRRFLAADMPQHHAILTREQARDRQVPRQTGLQPDQAALRAAYAQCRLALGTEQQIYTDGSGQTSPEGGGTRIGAGVYDACRGSELTVDPCGDGPTHTVHRAELVAIQAALQHCAHDGDVGILTDSQASMDGIRNYMQRPSHMRTHKYRDLLRDIVSRLAARG